MLMLMRCALAFSALAIVWIDAAEPRQWVDQTRLALGVYCLYGALLALRASRSGWPQPHKVLHWVDVFFYVCLVALTDGTSSIFFNFFLFSILAASFSWGFREGALVSAVSLAAFLAVGSVMTHEADFELNQALIRGVYLFVFGTMISYWGGHEWLLKRRLALLNEINNAWSPRFGVDHALRMNLDRLRNFYDAASCILILKRPGSPCHVMYRSLREKPMGSSMPVTLIDKASAPLLSLPTMLAAFFHSQDGSWWRRWRGHASCDTASGVQSTRHREECAALANLLDEPDFVSVPYAQRDGTSGRLFVAGGSNGFGQSDIEFLVQAAAAIATVIENITLMEELISRASDQERARISRDLHDTTIQPYIGLKLALDALQREAGQRNPLAPRLSELADMAGMTIRDLRNYAASFREPSSMPGEFLLKAIRDKAERLRRFYGIDVTLDFAIAEHLDGRLVSTAFHIVSEGLSNILRHTSAKAVFVHMKREGGYLVIDIGNEARDHKQDFTPRSIFDRAHALGGSTSVECDRDGYTVVRVSIPL